MSTPIQHLLGAPESRYLSAGWRRYARAVRPVSVSSVHVSGFATVSAGAGEGRTVDHLSSIDVLALMEPVLRLLRPAGGWAVTELDVRTPAEPTPLGDQIPVRLELVDAAGTTSTYTGRIGGFPVTVTGMNVDGSDIVLVDSRLQTPETSVSSWSASDSQIAAVHTPTTALPLCNVVAIVGELIEAALVQTTGTDREQLGDIWMRRIRVRRKPTAFQNMSRSVVTLERLQELSVRGSRVFDVHAKAELSGSAVVHVMLGVIR
ncbi:hypothetical protein F8O07_06685 [Pseudoclavibacter sp. CFCC 13796]|uniref:hypothetical protein n=1 Tax=Pseudoclavibacter sp. CFCC 13796 TaxID=2615179 RepID=UPI0013011AAC|nr:hypothetical protein [Pseudoclavibacter sp. CFCC 13796]KAB1661585.1 hypothetical protein F8O07_06685 [Pseudoclavibacter sp. CFCC 13796]